MPAPRPNQGGGALAAAICFIILFVIAAVLAVVFYIQADNYKTQYNNLSQEVDAIASRMERSNIISIVGKQAKDEETNRSLSYIGTLNYYLDKLLSAVTGEVPVDVTAAVKINDASLKISETLQNLGQDAYTPYGPEGIDLLHIITALKMNMDTARQNALQMQAKYNELQDDFDMYVTNAQLEADKLMDEKSNYQALADETQQMYADLENQMKEASEQQLLTFKQTFDNKEMKIEEQDQELLRIQAQLGKIQNDLDIAMAKIETIKPKPDSENIAFKPDARIVTIDPKAKIITLDIGSKDHAYRGLTFAIYDSGVPIPEDGAGKAEIEIFKVTPNASAARIISYSKKNPIAKDDIVANLIWDSTLSNRFVVAGEFDLDRDGRVDPDGSEKIGQLIEKWGGTIVKGVTIDTDFVVLGSEPSRRVKPTLDELERDPMSQQRYDNYLAADEAYDQIIMEANKLSVPVFNQDRFLYLIGYDSLTKEYRPE